MDSPALPQNHTPLPLPETAHRDGERVQEDFKDGVKPLPFVKEVFRRFGEDNASLMAAAMSFFALMAFVPILLVAVSAFSYFMKSTDAQHKVVASLSGFLPSLAESSSLKNDLFKFLSGLVQSPGKTTAGIVGLLGLVWSSSALFLNLETALNVVLGVKTKRNFLVARGVALGVMALLGALLVGSTGISWAISAIQGYKIALFAGHSPGDLPFVFDVIGFLVPVLLTFAMFLAIYKIIPNAKIHTRPAMVGAAFSALFFELAKRGFGWYVGHYGNFDKVYGTLGIIIFLVTWILYSFMITMLGAEIVDVYSEAVCGEPVVQGEKGGKPQTKPAKASPAQ